MGIPIVSFLIFIIAVVVPDSFMELIHKATKASDFDDSWDLIDPHTKQVVKTVSARALWVKSYKIEWKQVSLT